MKSRCDACEELSDACELVQVRDELGQCGLVCEDCADGFVRLMTRRVP